MIEPTLNTTAEPLGFSRLKEGMPPAVHRIEERSGKDTLVLAHEKRSFWGMIVDYFWSAWECIKGAFASLFSENREHRGVLQELSNLKNDFRKFSRDYIMCSSDEERQVVIKKFHDEFNILNANSQKEVREQILTILRKHEPEESDLYYIKRLNHILYLDPFMRINTSATGKLQVVLAAIIRHADEVILKSEQIGE